MSLLALIRTDLDDATSWSSSQSASQIAASQSQLAPSQSQVGPASRFSDNGHILRMLHVGESTRLALIEFKQQDKPLLEAWMHDGNHRVTVQFASPSLRGYREAYGGASIAQLPPGTTLELQEYHVLVRPQASVESRLHIIASTVLNTSKHVQQHRQVLIDLHEESIITSGIQALLEARSLEIPQPAAKSNPSDRNGHILNSPRSLDQHKSGPASAKQKTSAPYTSRSLKGKAQHRQPDDILPAPGVNLAVPQAAKRTSPTTGSDIQALLGLLNHTTHASTTQPALPQSNAHPITRNTHPALVERHVIDDDAPATQVSHGSSVALDVQTQLPGRSYTQEVIDLDEDVGSNSQAQAPLAAENATVGQETTVHKSSPPQDHVPCMPKDSDQRQSPPTSEPISGRGPAPAEETIDPEDDDIDTTNADNAATRLPGVSQQQSENRSKDRVESMKLLAGKSVSLHRKNFNFVSLLEMIDAESADIPDNQMAILAKSHQYPHPPFQFPPGNVPVELLTEFNKNADLAAVESSSRPELSRQMMPNGNVENKSADETGASEGHAETSDEEDQPYPWSSSPAQQPTVEHDISSSSLQGKPSSSLGSPMEAKRRMLVVHGSTLPPDSSAVINVVNSSPSRRVPVRRTIHLAEPQDPRQGLASLGGVTASQSQGQRIPGLPLLDAPPKANDLPPNDVMQVEDSSSSDIEMDVPQALPVPVSMAGNNLQAVPSPGSTAHTPTSHRNHTSQVSASTQGPPVMSSPLVRLLVDKRPSPRQLVPNTPNTNVLRPSGASISRLNKHVAPETARRLAHTNRPTNPSLESISVVKSSSSKRHLADRISGVDRPGPPRKRQRKEDFDWDRPSQVEDPQDIKKRMRDDFLKDHQRKVSEPASPPRTPGHHAASAQPASESATGSLQGQHQNRRQAEVSAAQGSVLGHSTRGNAQSQVTPVPLPRQPEPRPSPNAASLPSQADARQPGNDAVSRSSTASNLASVSSTGSITAGPGQAKVLSAHPSSPTSVPGSAAARPSNAPTLAEASMPKASNSRIFYHFKSTYPAYKGDLQHFLGLCSQIRELTSGQTFLHRSLWDDFIIRHMTVYVPFQIRLSYEGKVAPAYKKYYDDEIDEPLYTERVMNPKTLEEVLTQTTAGPIPTDPAASAPSNRIITRMDTPVAPIFTDSPAASHTKPTTSAASEHAQTPIKTSQIPASRNPPRSSRGKDVVLQQHSQRYRSAALPADRRETPSEHDFLPRSSLPAPQREQVKFTIPEGMAMHVLQNLDDVRRRSSARVDMNRRDASGVRTINVQGTAEANRLAISLVNSMIEDEASQRGKQVIPVQNTQPHQVQSQSHVLTRSPAQGNHTPQPAAFRHQAGSETPLSQPPSQTKVSRAPQVQVSKGPPAQVPTAPKAMLSKASQVQVAPGRLKDLVRTAGSARKRDAAHDGDDSPQPSPSATSNTKPVTKNTTSGTVSASQDSHGRSLPWQRSAGVAPQIDDHSANGKVPTRGSRSFTVGKVNNLHGQNLNDNGRSSQSSRHEDWWRDEGTPFNDFARNFMGARSYPYAFGTASANEFSMARVNTSSTRTRKGIDPLAWRF